MGTVSDETKKKIALGIVEHGLFNFGEFTFKSGIKSPMYMNLRNLLSYPEFLKDVAKAYAELIDGVEYDRLGAIPYGAISMASALSLKLNTPWLCARKESKEYGMGKDLIGDFEEGETVLIIDDLVTNGDSKVESLGSFTGNGLSVKDFAVMLDYDRGATEMLAEKGFNLHRMMTVREAVDIIHNEGKIDDEMYQKCVAFLDNK
jgi:orotate phosphoribosyltransferase